MLADSLPTNAWLSCEMRPSRLQRAFISGLNRVAVGAPDTANAPIAFRLVTPDHHVAAAERRLQ
jgi:hypothetical protein